MMEFDTSWDSSADRSIAKYRYSRPTNPKNLRWCPGVYTDPKTGEKSYHDVWLKYFLYTKTPFDTFEELFDHVVFDFERNDRLGKSSGDTECDIE